MSNDPAIAPPVLLDSDVSDVEDVCVPSEKLDTVNSPPHSISGNYSYSRNASRCTIYKSINLLYLSIPQLRTPPHRL